MIGTWWRAAVFALGLLCSGTTWTQTAAAGAASAPAPQPKLRALPTEAREWTGDFDEMLERRHIRVLVPNSRTLYYNVRGRERGI